MNQEYTNLLLLHGCNVLFKLIDKRSHVQLIYRVIDELPTINRLGLSPHDEIEKIKSTVMEKVDSSYTGIDNMVETTKKSLERHGFIYINPTSLTLDDIVKQRNYAKNCGECRPGDAVHEQLTLLNEACEVLERVVKYSDVPHLINYMLQCITVEEYRTVGLCCAAIRGLKSIQQEMHAKFLDKMWDLQQRIEGVLSSEHARDIFMIEIDAACRPEKEEQRRETKSEVSMDDAKALLWRCLETMTNVLKRTPDVYVQEMIWNAMHAIPRSDYNCPITPKDLIDRLSVMNNDQRRALQFKDMDDQIKQLRDAIDTYVLQYDRKAQPEPELSLLVSMLVDTKDILFNVDYAMTKEKINAILDRAQSLVPRDVRSYVLFIISELHDMNSANKIDTFKVHNEYGRITAAVKTVKFD